MGRIKFTEDDVVANVGPSRLAAKLHIQAMPLADSHLHSSNQRGSIQQRHEADTELTS